MQGSVNFDPSFTKCVAFEQSTLMVNPQLMAALRHRLRHAPGFLFFSRPIRHREHSVKTTSTSNLLCFPFDWNRFYFSIPGVLVSSEPCATLSPLSRDAAAESHATPRYDHLMIIDHYLQYSLIRQGTGRQVGSRLQFRSGLQAGSEAKFGVGTSVSARPNTSVM